MDDIAGVALVLLPQVLEDPDLLLRLPVEPLFVPHHLESHVLVGLVVVHLEHLTKRALAYHLQDLVPEVKNDFTLFSNSINWLFNLLNVITSTQPLL